MSTAQTTQLTLASRAGAYVALTKPDVSLLVLMTTGGGFTWVRADQWIGCGWLIPFSARC